MKDLRRRLYGWGAGAAYWALPRMPDWFSRALVRATVVPISRWKFSRRAEENLIKVYGDRLSAARRRQILDEVFQGMGHFLVECLGAVGKGHDFYRHRLDDGEARALVERLEAASHKGWIGVVPHLGNWILLAAWAGWLPGRGRCHALAKRQPNPALNALMEKAHARIDVVPLYADDPPLKVVGQILKQLKAGSRVGIVADEDSRRAPGIFVDFLGHPAYTVTGPAQLALSTDVPLVPMALVRRDGGFQVLCRDPIYPDQAYRSRRDEIRRLTLAWKASLEEMIHEYPGQWFWIHRRWRTTPEKLEARRKCRPSTISSAK